MEHTLPRMFSLLQVPLPFINERIGSGGMQVTTVIKNVYHKNVNVKSIGTGQVCFFFISIFMSWILPLGGMS